MAEQPADKPEAEIKKMTDYQSNSRKSRGGGQPAQEKIEVHKVVTGEVVVQRKTFGRKAKEAVVAADFKSVGGYLIWDVLVPAVKNVIVDTATKGIERAIYGDRAIRSRDSSISSRGRVQYPYHQHSDPINRRGERGVIDARAREIGRGSSTDNEPYIFSSRDDAERILDEMTEIIERHGYVTVATLKELMGFLSTPVDWTWGWDTVIGVKSRQVREGYLIDFPSPKAIRNN